MAENAFNKIDLDHVIVEANVEEDGKIVRKKMDFKEFIQLTKKTKKKIASEKISKLGAKSKKLDRIKKARKK